MIHAVTTNHATPTLETAQLGQKALICSCPASGEATSFKEREERKSRISVDHAVVDRMVQHAPEHGHE